MRTSVKLKREEPCSLGEQPDSHLPPRTLSSALEIGGFAPAVWRWPSAEAR